jgi:hypothetical protein
LTFELNASIKKPMTADAARPPRSLTTMYLIPTLAEERPLGAPKRT